MIVISYGVRKSGSTLAFEMAKAVLELSGHAQPQLAHDLVEVRPNANVVGAWTDDRLARLIEATDGTRIAIKTHGPPDPLSTGVLFRALESGLVKIHVVFRDPRDIVLSLLDHGARSRAKNRRTLSRIVSIDDAVAKLRADLRNLRHWGGFPSLKLLYDDFAFGPTSGPQRIADDLGVRVEADEVWELVNRRRTKRNVARSHRYRTEMSPDDAARIADAVPNYLKLIEDNDLGWFQAVG